MGQHRDYSLTERPRLEVADIFSRYKRLLGPLPSGHWKVVEDLVDCRTRRLGGHLRRCDSCSHQDQSYNSCRNRHCPKCQFLKKQKWVENRTKELLPVEYFHVVFTVPHILNPLTLQNKSILYNILFKAASETMKEVATRRLGAEIGFVTALHTWGQNLIEHPHLHMIVPGGGLRRDRLKWVSCKKGYLFPIKILSTVFRGKFLSLLEKSHDDLEFYGRISTLSTKTNFKGLLVEAAKIPWVVYAKKPFAGPKQVVSYLGQYTHRIAISNHRLIKVEENQVHFQYRDYADKNQNKVMVLSVEEFMRRFLLHVLPKKFIRIRHYGFLGNRLRREKISCCKSLLGIKAIQTETTEKIDWKQQLKALTGIDLTLCPICKIPMREMIVPRDYQDSS